MTKKAAIEWVQSHADDDELDDDDLEAAFVAIFGRKPDDDEYDQGLWSHICAAVSSEKT